MEILSLLSGIDNLRKLAVVLGLILIGFGTLFPLQKNLELKDKEIKLEQARKLDSTEVKNLESEVNKSTLFIKTNNENLDKLNHQIDSLLQLKLDEPIKFRINLLNEEIKSIELKNETLIKDEKSKYLQIEKTIISTESLRKEICNLNSFINKYIAVQITFIILGLFLFITGMLKWKKSQEESDNLKNIEIDIKKEELKKIQKEVAKL